MINRWQRFFGGAEYEIICRIGASFSDPEQKKAFWNTVREKKEANAAWSIFDDFPDMRGQGTKTQNAMQECCEFVRSLRITLPNPVEQLVLPVPPGGWLTEANPGDYRHSYEVNKIVAEEVEEKRKQKRKEFYEQRQKDELKRRVF